MNEYEQKNLTRFLPKLPAVKVRVGKLHYTDTDTDTDTDNDGEDFLYTTKLEKDKIYLVLGEVGDIDHYILLDYATGKIMPGIFHLDNLVRLDNDEL